MSPFELTKANVPEPWILEYPGPITFFMDSCICIDADDVNANVKSTLLASGLRKVLLMVNQLLLMDQNYYQEIHLTVLFCYIT